MNKGKIFASILLPLIMVGCDQTFSGFLKLTESVSVQTSKGVRSLKAGQYIANLKVKNEKEVNLEVGTDKDSKLKIPFKITPASQIPKNGNGPIFISGKDNGQNFNVIGSLQTEITNGPNRRDWESCQRVIQEHVCYPVGNSHASCRWETRYYPGRQETEYYIRTTREVLNADVKLIQDGRTLGTFASDETSRHRIDVYQGPCW